MSSALTFYFEDIFPTEQSFIDFCNDQNVSDLTQAPNLDAAKYFYRVLLQNYVNCNIQYDTPTPFKMRMAQILTEHFAQFKAQYTTALSLTNMSEDDLRLIGESLTNHAYNPNTTPEDPRKPLEFISAQDFNFSKDNKYRSFLNALNSMPSTRAKEFAERFRHLFKSNFNSVVTYYKTLTGGQ